MAIKSRNHSFVQVVFQNSSNSMIALLILGIMFAVFTGAVQPVVSVLFGRMIDIFTFYLQGSYTVLEFKTKAFNYSMDFIYLAVFLFLMIYLYTFSFTYFGGKFLAKIKIKYLNSVLNRSISWHDNYNSGDLTMPITSNTEAIQNGICERLPLIIKDLSIFVSGFIVSFYISWILAVSIICVVPAIFLTVIVSNLFYAKYMEKETKFTSKANSIAQDTLLSIKTVYAFNLQDKLNKMFGHYSNISLEVGYKKIIASSVCSGLLVLILYCTYSLTYYVGGKLYVAKNITTGNIVGVSSCIITSSFALANLTANIQSFLVAISYLNQIIDKITNKDSLDATSNNFKSGLSGDIEFNNVSFGYNSRKGVKALEKFNLKVRKDTSIALVGSSGSGKSTIIGLLERFYEPTEGYISMGGKNIKEYNIEYLRKSIGLVSQQPILFNATIAENVAYGLIGTIYEKLTIPENMQRIIKACMEANAHEFIRNMPEQYLTSVGEKGCLLSGGQKQRIAIARAIIKDPKILLLDEATSALDTKSERIVQKALDMAKVNRTTITIAHRLSTIKNSDLIVVMDKGRVIESGSHNSLLNQKGNYSKLIELQKLEEETKHDETDINSINEKHFSVNTCTSIKTAGAVSEKTIIEYTQDIEGKSKNSYNIFKIVFMIYNINKREKIYCFLGILGSAILGFSYPIFAVLYSKMLFGFSKDETQIIATANFWCLIFLILAFCLGAGSFIESFGFMTYSERLSERIKKLYFLSYSKKEMSFFDIDKNSATSLTSQMSTNSQSIKNIAGMTCGAILQGVFNMFGAIIVAMIYGWKLTLVVICTLPLLLYSGYLQINFNRKSQQRNRELNHKSSQLASEAITEIKTVLSLNRHKEVLKNYEVFLEDPLKSNKTNSLMLAGIFAFSQSLINFISALTFWYTSVLFVTDGYNLTQACTVFIALVLGTNNVAKLFAYAPEISKAKQASTSFFENIKTSNFDELKGNENTLNLIGEIEFKSLQFSYPIKPNIKILKNVSFKASAGQYIALVGPSGCGKSTIISMIEKFYTPNSGKILIDGKNITNYNTKALRNKIGLVSQEPYLYDMSIKENILFGLNYVQRNTISDNRIIEICKMCNIHDFIISLPDGYDTNLGKSGSQLSGGQKQMISIARVLIYDPKILLLDEATSALDADSENQIQTTIESIRKNKTIISIAHRLSTIQTADQILVFKNGNIIERGNHVSLISKKGLYYEMVREQNLKA